MNFNVFTAKNTSLIDVLNVAKKQTSTVTVVEVIAQLPNFSYY
jgi:hypothetical protein